ncbi:MAG: hypothetical protein NTU85_00140 [Candidatus Kaiserbacteria bacterium]|nr:hypothetical protein [Candidatus Kaiserbacteria bacterium]
MNQQPSKMISQLTDQEILHIGRNDPVNAGNIRSVFVQGIEQMRYQLDRIEKELSDFTQRTALLMTIAGLLAFLPSVIGLGPDYLSHFLVWTFPFLLLSLACFYFSSPRISALATQIPTAASGTPEELIILKAQSNALEDIWKRSLSLYNHVLEWYRFTSASIYMYITSFAANLYMFVFIGEPNVCSSVLLLFSLFVLGIWMVLRYQVKSERNISYGPVQLEIATGGPPHGV